MSSQTDNLKEVRRVRANLSKVMDRKNELIYDLQCVIEKQSERIAELEKLNDAYSATVRILVADLRGNR